MVLGTVLVALMRAEPYAFYHADAGFIGFQDQTLPGNLALIPYSCLVPLSSLFQGKTHQRACFLRLALGVHFVVKLLD